jgi:hypothetical protein
MISSMKWSQSVNNIKEIKLTNLEDIIELRIEEIEVVIVYSNTSGGYSLSSFPYANLRDLEGLNVQTQRVILDFVKSVLKPYRCSIILEDYICASIWEKFQIFLEKKVV